MMALKFWCLQGVGPCDFIDLMQWVFDVFFVCLYFFFTSRVSHIVFLSSLHPTSTNFGKINVIHTHTVLVVLNLFAGPI